MNNDCELCAHAEEHAWWGRGMPSGGTHCKVCHRTWTGTAEIHCVSCHCHFSCINALERHQEQGQCLDPLEIQQKSGEPAFKTRESRFGVTFQRWTEPGLPFWK